MEKQILIACEGKNFYGFPAESVVEVLSELQCTPLPKEMKYVEGVCNYKGNILPAVSLGKLIGAAALVETTPASIIMTGPKGRICVRAEQVINVIEDKGERIPWDKGNQDEGILKVTEIIKWKEPVFLVDIGKTLERIEEEIV